MVPAAPADPDSDEQLAELLHEQGAGDAAEQLRGYQREDESLATTIQRLVDAHPHFVDLECQECGCELDPLDDRDWLAWRLRIEDTDRRRTDLFCGPSCLADGLGAEWSWGDPTDSDALAD